MATATATNPRTKAARKRATGPKVLAKWRALFRLIPGYDPIASATAGDWFDEQAAEQAIAFFPECLKHVKGPKAGQPFELERWQKAVTGCLFGWKRSDGLRRYRECLLYVAKKNGKSAWVAGLILYMLVCDGEQGAELYSAAASRDQASLVFAHAAGMVRQESHLSERLTVYGARGGSVTKSIVYEDAFGSYKCLAADANTADGANVHMAAIDELHRHKTPELAEVLQKSTASRSQPLVIYTTTADYNRESLCNTKLKYARQVRDNGGRSTKPGFDPEFLPVIFEASTEDDWTDPAVWAKANPNMDVSVPKSFLARECRKAQDTPSELNNFLRLHLNIVTDSDVAFFPMQEWDAVGAECTVNEQELQGHDCFTGVDLSSTRDITAVVHCFPDEDGGYSVLPRFFVPEHTARDRERKDGVPYSAWAREGFIELTSGNVVDYDVIHEHIKADGEQFHIREIAIDRWNSTQLQTQLIGDGFEVVPFGQGFASMSAPTKEIEKLVVEGTFNHGNNPVLRWMAKNTTAETDAAGNLKPSKKRSSEKIDGIVAAIMALGRAMVSEGEKESVYEKPGASLWL